jgi:hypothetical protein
MKSQWAIYIALPIEFVSESNVVLANEFYPSINQFQSPMA